MGQDVNAGSTPRVGDAERYQLTDILAVHLADGRLTQEEFETRVDRALAAKTASDLLDLVADLPAGGRDERKSTLAHFKAALPPAITNLPGLFQFLLMLGVIAVIAVVAGVSHELIEGSGDSGGSTMFLSLLACGLIGAVAGGVWAQAQNRRNQEPRSHD